MYFVMGGLTLVPSKTEAVQLDDGDIWTTAAGVGSVRRLFLLWDRHRRIPHHSPGSFSN